MKNNNKVLSLLGLATKAGKVASGEFSTEKSVKTGKGFLVLVADDASQNTRKSSRTCVIFTKYRSTLLPTKKNWADSAEKNSAPALRYRMKTLQKQC